MFSQEHESTFPKKPKYIITHMQWLKKTGIKKPNHVNMNSAVGEFKDGEGILYYLTV
jgi:hypothetical protein